MSEDPVKRRYFLIDEIKRLHLEVYRCTSPMNMFWNSFSDKTLEETYQDLCDKQEKMHA